MLNKPDAEFVAFFAVKKQHKNDLRNTFEQHGQQLTLISKAVHCHHVKKKRSFDIGDSTIRELGAYG